MAHYIGKGFNYYVKGVSAGFATTMVVNIGYGIVNPTDTPISIYDNPHFFVAGALAKSVQHGILWPAIPISIVTSPRHYACLGAYAKECSEELEKQVTDENIVE